MLRVSQRERERNAPTLLNNSNAIIDYSFSIFILFSVPIPSRD